MKIAWEPCVYGGKVPVTCAICGHRSLPLQIRPHHFLLAVVYTQQGSVFGEACRACVSSGVEGIRQRLQERLNSLQSQIRDIEILAADPDLELPSVEAEFQFFSRD